MDLQAIIEHEDYFYSVVFPKIQRAQRKLTRRSTKGSLKFILHVNPAGFPVGGGPLKASDGERLIREFPETLRWWTAQDDLNFSREKHHLSGFKERWLMRTGG